MTNQHIYISEYQYTTIHNQNKYKFLSSNLKWV